MNQDFRKDVWSDLWYWVPLLVYAGAIIYLSSLSVPKQEFAGLVHIMKAMLPSQRDVFSIISDKYYHIAEYAILGVLTYRAIRYSWGKSLGASAGMLAMLCIIVFGCSDEVHQWFTPLRETDGWDLLADTIGGFLGVSAWEVVRNIPLIRVLDETIPLKLQMTMGMLSFKV
ncbi:MAG: VanZ family protein [Nitrospira sp.]|nr:VanZ family protein [Nitrospira sp.]MCB9711930.1 VanZ family protein [Nitrospiraceae bacterium]MDR4488840.1 VanZ family protein [Nitrospirales bacterium]MCA9475013.1 VanZ family protein [Nitrospira sp.]MCA9479081.1 VanZ family protein [Nitrospira sp.]